MYHKSLRFLDTLCPQASYLYIGFVYKWDILIASALYIICTKVF